MQVQLRGATAKSDTWGLATMLYSGIGQNIDIQYDDRLDYDLKPPEKLIYEVDGDHE